MPKETSTTKTETSLERPTKAKFGPYIYSIEYVDEVVYESGESSSTDEEVTLGHAFCYSSRIVVKNGQHPRSERDTILHESLHAMWDASGLGSIENLNEETVVSVLSPWLLMFQRDNPELVSYLQS